MLILSIVFFLILALSLLVEAIALNILWVRAVQKIVKAIVADTNVTLKSLLASIETIPAIANAVKLSLDSQSLVVGRAIDHLNVVANGLSIEILPDMFDKNMDENVDSFIQSLEYARDKFTESPFEKRAILGAINRIKKQYGK